MAETPAKSSRSLSPDSGAKRQNKSYSGMVFDNFVLTIYAKHLRDDLGGENDTQLPKEEALEFLKGIAPDVREIVVYGKEGDVESNFGKIKRDYRAALMTSVDETVDEYLLYQLEDSPLTKLTLRHVSMLNPVTINGLYDRCVSRNMQLIVENIQINTEQSIFFKEAPYQYGDEGYILEITGEESLLLRSDEKKSTKANGDKAEREASDETINAKIADLAKKYATPVSKEKQEDLKKQLVELEKDDKLSKDVQEFVSAVLKQYAPDLLKNGANVEIASLDFSKIEVLPLRLLWWWSTWADTSDKDGEESKDKNGSTNGSQNDESAADSKVDRKISMVHRGKKSPGKSDLSE